jgi:hypothetical protein
MTSSICSVIDHQGCRVAEVEIQGVEDEWYHGRLVEATLPEGLRRDLAWYDEVISQQMLSYLDDALHAVERHGLSVCFPDDTCHRVYSLHIDPAGETTFRITPVPPPDSNRMDNSTILG